jgi:hypothetical protein
VVIFDGKILLAKSMESGEKGLGQIEDSSSFSTLLQNL